MSQRSLQPSLLAWVIVLQDSMFKGVADLFHVC
jgi:hypothetical protein